MAAPARANDDEEKRALLFSGRDLWRNGAFAYGGLLLAPGGLEQDGFNLKLVLAGGLYRYIGGSAAGDPPGFLAGWQIVGAETMLLAMPGWRVKRGDLEVKVFFGLDVERHRLWPDDPSNRLRGHDTGLRFTTEFWYEPNAMTMVAGDAALSSIATQRSLRLAFGWRMFDQFYFGPETQYFGSDGYRHWRLGGHFTALKTEENEWLAAGGWARDSDGRSSPYVRLGVTMRP
ncbi:MAG: cellulose biosynthesis protein BcsS [Rhizobiales bacterium]|nr:cellulose biosynthesis protein BcsS [Hyphomicrobiales bacterium]